MSGLYEEFENRHMGSFFSAGWIEVEVKPQEVQAVQTVARKDISTLEAELDAIKENIENISQKQLRLSNLAKMYNV